MANRNFFISGFVAFGFYFSIIFLFFFIVTFKSDKKIVEVGSNVNQPIDVILEDNIKITNEFSAPQISTEIPKEKPVEISKPEVINKPQDTKELFSNIPKTQNNAKLFDDFASQKTKEIKKPTPDIPQAQPVQVQKKFEYIKEERKSIPSYAVNVSQQKTAAIFSQATKKNADQYYSKIYDLLNQKFKPSGILKNSSSKVNIFIDKNGRFDYFVVSKSLNQNFDNQLFSFLENQKKEIFPLPPEGNKISIEVTFTSKGL